MKKINTLTLLFLLIFTSCEEVVDIEVPTTTPKLVIDAAFEVFFNENPVTANTVVKLRLSADYFNEEIPIVTNATVFLTDVTNATIINYTDTNADGNYDPETSFIPTDNTLYELTVIYNNETYKGRAVKVKSTPITNITQENGTLFSGEETELKVSFSDDGAQENHYLFDFTRNKMIPIEDRFLNGSDYTFSFFFEEDEIELPTDITVKMSGITKEYFSYFNILLNQSGQNSGGPFQAIPSLLLGNMINTTLEDNFALGYFHISETDTFDISLIEN